MSLSRKTALGGLFIALSVLLPQVIHLIGAADLGRMLPPMHIPVLLSGFVLGPVSAYGGSDFHIELFAHQYAARVKLAFMVIELAGYGFMSGLLFRTLKLYKTRYGTALSCGRYDIRKAFVRSFYLSPQTFWGFLKLDPSRRGKRSLRD